MNKIKLILTFISIFYLCGCTQIISSNTLETTSTISESEQNTENSRYEDSQIASVYRDVLNNELQFYSTDEQEWTYLNEFDYYDGEQGQEVDPLKFRLVDVNGDVNFEIQIVVTTPEEYPGMRAELLCYEDGKVYGYAAKMDKWWGKT